MVAPYVALGQRKQTSIKGKIYNNAKRQTHPEQLGEIKHLVRSADSITGRAGASGYRATQKSKLYRKVPSLERYPTRRGGRSRAR